MKTTMKKLLKLIPRFNRTKFWLIMGAATALLIYNVREGDIQAVMLIGVIGVLVIVTDTLIHLVAKLKVGMKELIKMSNQQAKTIRELQEQVLPRTVPSMEVNKEK